MSVDLNSSNLSTSNNALSPDTENVGELPLSQKFNNSIGIIGSSIIDGVANASEEIQIEAPTTTLEQIAEAMGNLSPSDQTRLSELIAKLNPTKADSEGNTAVAAAALSDEDVDFLCILLTQSAKSKLVETIKTKLKDAINEKTKKMKEYQAKVADCIKKNIEAAEAAKKAQEAKKKKSIWGAIISAVVAVVAVVVTVATCGAGGPLAVAAIACCAAACACSLVSAGLSIAQACGVDNKAMSLANKVLGYCGMAFGLVGCGCNIANVIKTAAKEAVDAMSKSLTTVQAVVDATGGIVDGAMDISLGVTELKVAELEKLANEAKIDQEKLDQVIQLLSQFLTQLQNCVYDFIRNILDSEQTAAEMLNRVQNAMLRIGNPVV
jgi:hypothetical protein